MESNQIFDIKRFWLTLKRDIIANLKTYLSILFIVLGLFLLGYFFKFFISMFSNVPQTVNVYKLRVLSKLGFLIVGTIFSGIAFKDFRNKLTTMTYLMLPASKLEKFLSVWLITTLGFIVTYFVSFIVFNFALMLLGLIFGVSVPFLNFFAVPGYWTIIGIYLVVQSIFLAGAATFEKVPILITLLIYWLIQFIFNIALGLVALLIFMKIAVNYNIEPAIALKFNLLKQIGKLLLYITPFVFWTITYFKLSEKQV